MFLPGRPNLSLAGTENDLGSICFSQRSSKLSHCHGSAAINGSDIAHAQEVWPYVGGRTSSRQVVPSGPYEQKDRSPGHEPNRRALPVGELTFLHRPTLLATGLFGARLLRAKALYCALRRPALARLTMWWSGRYAMLLTVPTGRIQGRWRSPREGLGGRGPARPALPRNLHMTTSSFNAFENLDARWA
jgi:hypothetical protein